MLTGHFKYEDGVPRKIAGMLGLITLCLIVSASSWAVGNGDVEKGKVIYREGCQHCHGLRGQRNG